MRLERTVISKGTLHVLRSCKDLCFVCQSQGLHKVDGNVGLRVKWIGT